MKKNDLYKVEWTIIEEKVERFFHQLVLKYIELAGDDINLDEVMEIFNLDNEELDEILDSLHDMGYIKLDFISRDIELL